jgi:hypothetical protein
MRLPSGDYVLIVSAEPGEHGLDAYKKRWKIEVLFEALNLVAVTLQTPM